MIKPTIADTGIIVGLIYEKDQWHEWVLEQSTALFPPFLTCEAVITEACHLLKGGSGGKESVLGMISDGYLQIDFSVQTEISHIETSMKKYADVPMDFADACLVRMSELIENSVVFTVDGDFRIYRKHKNKEIPLIIPNKL